MTINQALDQIFVSYQKKDVNKFPDVTRLKQSLVDLKIHYGGNTLVENEDTVKNIIKFGSSDPENWK
jgi:hypothetical protein